MKIKLDETHFLNSDGKCYWITKLTEAEKKNTKAKYMTERRVSGYKYTLHDAIESMLKMDICGTDVDKLTALNRKVNKLIKDVKKWRPAIEESRS